jgi:SAM-dependent methyltransferase
MKSSIDRRKFFQLTLTGILQLYFLKTWGQTASSQTMPDLAGFIGANQSLNPGNFQAVFSNPTVKQEFFLFLKNVFHIYPEKKFFALITKLANQHKSDQEIYQALQKELKSIKPLLSELSYALPALKKQKKEIVDQTLQFLKGKKTISGYLEIGSPGRYIGELKERIKVKGDLVLVHTSAPSFSPLDIAERGQLPKIGRYLPLSDYAPIACPENSFDLVTNYIGFHHSPLAQLDGFIDSIQKILKPGGQLILRDHDVSSEQMNHMVSLAHDVFNAGLKESWETNHQEIRNFRSLEQWVQILEKKGLKYQGRVLYQAGDPTKNALMEFVKV